jgi:hypothetical protein
MFKLQNDLNIIKPPFEIISVHSLISSEIYCYINGLECLSNGIANKNQSSHHFQLYRTYFRDGHEKSARFIDEIVIIFEELGVKYTRFEGGVQYTID